jgi:hypothetical protein
MNYVCSPTSCIDIPDFVSIIQLTIASKAGQHCLYHHQLVPVVCLTLYCWCMECHSSRSKQPQVSQNPPHPSMLWVMVTERRSCTRSTSRAAQHGPSLCVACVTPIGESTHSLVLLLQHPSPLTSPHHLHH